MRRAHGSRQHRPLGHFLRSNSQPCGRTRGNRFALETILEREVRISFSTTTPRFTSGFLIARIKQRLELVRRFDAIQVTNGAEAFGRNRRARLSRPGTEVSARNVTVDGSIHDGPFVQHSSGVWFFGIAIRLDLFHIDSHFCCLSNRNRRFIRKPPCKRSNRFAGMKSSVPSFNKYRTRSMRKLFWVFLSALFLLDAIPGPNRLETRRRFISSMTSFGFRRITVDHA